MITPELYELLSKIIENQAEIKRIVDELDAREVSAGSGAVDSVNGYTGTVVLDPDDLDDSATTNKFTTAGDISKLAGIEALADVTDAGNVGTSIDGATAKTTPVDADTMPLIDSAASNVLKKVTWANIKATIATYYNSLAATLTNKTLDSTNISTLTAKTTPVDADSAVIVDSAASNVFKRVTYTNIKAFLKTYFDGLYNLYVHPNHSGDVTSVADGAQTIANDAVTNAKLANMATATFKGRTTAGTGDPEDLTVAQAVALLNATLDHGTLAGLSDDDHSIYAKLLGRSGGQTVYGGTGAGDPLILYATSNATKGTINLADILYVDDVNNRVGMGQSSPSYPVHIRTTDGGLAMLIDASATAYNAASGIMIIQDDAGRQCAFSSIGFNRRDFDGDTAAFAINFIGYNGGTTRYRDLAVYDGKNNAVMFVDGSAASVGVGTGTGAPTGKLHVDQPSMTAAIPVLLLDQADLSEEMIEFTGTVGTGNTIEAVGSKSLTTTHFIRVSITGVGYVYIPVGTIA